MGRAIGIAVAALSLIGAEAAGSAQDPISLSLQALAAKDLRVATIGYRLATGAVALCPQATHVHGLVVQDASQYRGDLRPTAARLFGLGDGAAVVAVVPGSAAERAGLRPHDRLRAINSVAIGDAEPDGRKPDQDRITAILDRLEAAFAAGPVRLKVERDGRMLEIAFEGTRGCASTIQMELGGGVNAGADGKVVTVSQGMVDNSPDDGLAYVMAHELSHNILRHGEWLDSKGTNRGLLAGFGKNRGRILSTEMEADYYAIYVMNAAGYAIDGVPAYWRGMGRFGPGIFGDGTHLGNRSRVRFLQRVVDELKAKRAAGGVPHPDFAAFVAAGGTRN